MLHTRHCLLFSMDGQASQSHCIAASASTLTATLVPPPHHLQPQPLPLAASEAYSSSGIWQQKPACLLLEPQLQRIGTTLPEKAAACSTPASSTTSGVFCECLSVNWYRKVCHAYIVNHNSSCAGAGQGTCKRVITDAVWCTTF